MSERMNQAWRNVGDEFSALGGTMRQHYKSAAESGDDGEDETAEVTNALRQAFERLIAAGREVGERTVKVARDDEVKSQAKQAASSLNGALSATVDLIGEQIGGLLSHAGKENAPTKTPRSDPPDDDARQ